MGKGNMAKRVIALTALVFMACVCSGYALTIPGLDRIYTWLGITKNNHAGEGISTTTKSPPTPTPTSTSTPIAKLTSAAKELRQRALSITQPEPLAMEVSLPSVWPPTDNVNWATFGQLECEGIPVGNGQSKLYRHPTPYTGTEGIPTPYPDGKPKVLLKLKGTFYEMGYAHGWALAHEIKNLWDKKVYPVLGDKLGYWDWYDYLAIPPEIEDEMKGIKDGINARYRADDPTLPVNVVILTEQDIFVMNAFAWFTSCSSFSHWGTGNRLVGRNTECTYNGTEGDKLLWQSGLVISREPTVGDGTPVPRKVVELTVPGRITAAVSINDAGLGFLGHAAGPLSAGASGDYCWDCNNKCCKALTLSLLGIMHIGTDIDSLINYAKSDSLGAGIYHIFSKDAVTCIEATGRDERERGRVPGDPSSALVVVAGCPKEWGSTYPCRSESQSCYDVLVDRINYVVADPEPGMATNPNVYLNSVLNIMWAATSKNKVADGEGTWHRYAINVKSIPVNIPADPDIRIILNVEDYNDRYGGTGLKVKWNELF